MDRFLGHLKGQKAMATREEETLNSEISDMLSQALEGEVVAATSMTLAQLVEQQKTLAEQIATFHKQDF